MIRGGNRIVYRALHTYVCVSIGSIQSYAKIAWDRSRTVCNKGALSPMYRFHPELMSDQGIRRNKRITGVTLQVTFAQVMCQPCAALSSVT